ncbi:unnamed protein product [Linum trigynum]|uniref:BHLH domain-containing protein n=2 Tax=Linum trigynum TaxID=586398 RepID=A0AAV2FFG0_9ROSI
MDDFLFGSELIPVVTGPAGRATPNHLNRGTAEFDDGGTERKAESSSREQSFRHMMTERLRREREKEAYADLHSLLPPSTKNEKNAIMRGAMLRIQELRGHKQALERRITELQDAGIESDHREIDSRVVKKIRIKVENPTSGLDSILDVLHLLKRSGAETTSIESRFSRQELEAAMDVNTQIEAGEVEEAVQRSLYDTERKLLSRGSPRSCVSQN